MDEKVEETVSRCAPARKLCSRQGGEHRKKNITEGDKVSFDVVEGDRGPKAEKVKKL